MYRAICFMSSVSSSTFITVNAEHLQKSPLPLKLASPYLKFTIFHNCNTLYRACEICRACPPVFVFFAVLRLFLRSCVIRSYATFLCICTALQAFYRLSAQLSCWLGGSLMKLSASALGVPIFECRYPYRYIQISVRSDRL